jgi:hypothetical protein
MSVVRITDVWMKNGSTAEGVKNYLVRSDAVLDATLSFTVNLSGDFTAELVVAVDDDHPHSDSVENEIHEMLIQARLDFVQCHLLHSLAWKFSSPAHISKLRELLDAKKIIK